MFCLRLMAGLLALVECAGADLAPAGRSDSKFRLAWVKAGSESQSGYRVELRGLDTRVVRRLAGAGLTAADWTAFLPVYVEVSGAKEATGVPMLGRYETTREGARFSPRFPLEPGLSYRAEFHSGRLPVEASSEFSAVLTARLEIPARKIESTTVVTRVYPSGDRLPENLLKFYVHFSGPMRRGDIYQYITLLGPDGQPIDLPFLELDEELWDSNLTRITLFIDPGRIKRGVRPLEEIGPVLEAGGTYRLVIDSNWPDANGAPLKAGYSKRFTAVEPDRTQPDPSKWKVVPPPPGGCAPLTVEFDERLDHALAERLIRVIDVTDAVVTGRASFEGGESVWRFAPDGPWRAGEYSLSVGTVLEDLAGNSVGRPFEVDLFEKIDRRIEKKSVNVPFWVVTRDR